MGRGEKGEGSLGRWEEEEERREKEEGRSQEEGSERNEGRPG